MFIDTHAHIHVKDFDADRAEVIKRALAANVSLINVGFDTLGNENAAKLADENKTIFWAGGYHPHHADLATDENLKKLEELARGPYGKKLVALGEMGMDYYRNLQPKQTQEVALRAQLKLAKKLDLPVIIHCRDAVADTLKILADEKMTQVVFHCFTGTLEEAVACWNRGYMTSFTAICTYEKAGNIREVIKNAPVDKIMLDSDCPYLAPQKYRGKRNEPAYVFETFNKIAEVKNIQPKELEKILFENTVKFFKLPITH
ncbi:TatD family hydrolase [Candidatus Peregrinibacteria bacterium]|nr:TatD family hydrolase [Candidatus Peregrinibacteria bacterium]